MHLPKYDLHCHSSASDGALEPGVLLERALANEIEILALTDHDTVAGVLALQQQGVPETLRLIPGAELTCDWQGRVLHVVGLGLDPTSPSLLGYLDQLYQLRISRGKKIARRLVRLGLPDLHAEAEAEAGDAVLGRPHFARALVAAGCVATESLAFKQYLGAGKPGDVKISWPSMEQAIAAIKQAGGVSVLAHPTKYKMTFSKLRQVLADFVECGGEGLEVSYPGVTQDQQQHLLRIAAQYKIEVSAGSDFHSPQHQWTELGKFPPLPDQDNHVLQRFC